MLSCMLGDNRNIFFPKLEEAQMMTFDEIARRLLKEYGFEIKECSSDEEAIEYAVKLKEGGRIYPVHFSKSDTSGEKAYEEFYTDDEKTDLSKYDSLGIIVEKEAPDRDKVLSFIDRLRLGFERPDITKEDVVNIIKSYLPGFEHIETGKSLDSKM